MKMTTYDLTLDAPDDPRLLTLLAAFELREQGIPAIPISLDSKKPAIKWKRYQTELPTDEALVEFFGRVRRNIAVVTGRFSRVVCMDTDNVTGVEWVEEHMPRSAARVRTGSGGTHFWYRHPGTPVKTRARVAGDPSIGVDVRGDGGYAIVPPSVHPRTKLPYEWISGSLQMEML